MTVPFPSPILPVAARRRAAAPASVRSTEPAHLVFSVGGRPYACAITGLEKLLRVADVSILPAPMLIHGLAGLLQAGTSLIPVIRVAALWRLAAAEGGILPTQSLLVLKTEGDRCALLVDACLGVLKALPPVSARLALPSALTAGHGLAFESMMSWGTDLLVKVRLEHLIPSDLCARIRALTGGVA